MATERQIAANRLNASRSTGPKTEAGKARSRANALKHGLAGESDLVEVGPSAAFEERRAEWGAEYRPVGKAASWALDRAVAASLRIDRCERASDEVAAAARERARLAWDQDRAVEAAVVAGRLARDPVLASRQLQASLAGVDLMLEAWSGLAAKLRAGGDWSGSEASRALDLLGVAPDLREGRTLIDAEGGGDPLAFRLELALGEIERLEALAGEALAPLDAMERSTAAGGESALLSKPSKLVLRYERDAWRRYRESIRQVRESAAPPVVQAPSPAPKAPSLKEGRSEARERALAGFAPSPTFEEERRALRREAMSITRGLVDPLVAMDLEDEEEWLDELERRVDARSAGGRVEAGRASGSGEGPATERSRFGTVAGSVA